MNGFQPGLLAHRARSGCLAPFFQGFAPLRPKAATFLEARRHSTSSTFGQFTNLKCSKPDRHACNSPKGLGTVFIQARSSIVPRLHHPIRFFGTSTRLFRENKESSETELWAKRFENAQNPVAVKAAFEEYLNGTEQLPNGKTIPRIDSIRHAIKFSRWSSIAFTIVTTIIIFTGFAALARADTKSLIRSTNLSKPSINELRYIKIQRTVAKARSFITTISRYFSKKTTQFVTDRLQWWINLTPAGKASMTIAGVNVTVFGAWWFAIILARNPSMVPPKLFSFMERWFLHRPISFPPVSFITPLTSTFSHSGLFHMLFNTLALASFAAGAGQYISSLPVQSGQSLHPSSSTSQGDTQEISGKYHFLAVYLSAGIFAALCSTLWSARLATSAIRTANHAAWTTAMKPSLGASGAVYAIVVISILEHPENPLRLIFFPFFDIPAMYGLTGLLAIDAYGLIAGWRTFGHAAHLGGAAFGAMYHAYGPQIWAWCRGPETRAYLLPQSVR